MQTLEERVTIWKAPDIDAAIQLGCSSQRQASAFLSSDGARS